MLITALITIAIIAAIVTIVLIVSTSGKKDKKSTKTNTNIQRKGKSSVIKEYEKKLVHDPHNVPALEALGDIYYDSGEWEKVWGVYKTLYEISTAHIEINMAKSTGRLGIAAFNLGKYDDAISYLLSSSRKDSENFDVNYHLGRSFFEKGAYDKAIICYKKCRLLSPESNLINEALAMCLFKVQKYKESLPFLKKVLEDQPDNKEVLYNMAIAMAESGYRDRALKVFIHLRPDPVFGAQSCLEAGKMHEYMKDFTAAVQDYEIGMKLENVPDKIAVQILYRCAVAYLGLNNIPRALTLLKRIQATHAGYRDVDTLVVRYQELNQNRNFQAYLMTGTSDFVVLCRNIISVFFKDAFVKIEDVAIAAENVEIICFVSSNKWQSKVMFRFYRSQTIIGDIYIREFHTKIRDTKCDNGYCVTLGTFSDSAHKYTEGRPIDLIEKDELSKILKKISLNN